MREPLVGDLLDRAVDRYGDRDAFFVGPSHIGYAGLAALANIVAQGLLNAGVKPGERLAVWMGNRIEWIALFHAAARIGVVLVPLSTRFKAEEARYILTQSGTTWLVMNERFVGVDFIRLLEEVAPGFQTSGQSAELPGLRSCFVVGAVDAPKEDLEARSSNRAIVPWTELSKDDGPQPGLPNLTQLRAALDPEAPFLIQYTSGTTGFPKGAVLSQRNFVWTGSEVGKLQQLTPDDRFFSPAPYFHVAGTMHAFIAPLAQGCTVYSVERYELQNVLETICMKRCTAYHGFNFFKDFFARREEFGNRYDLSTLKKAWTTGTAVDMANIEALGVRVCNLYGLSETTGCCSLNVADDDVEARHRTVGRPLTGVEICIQDRNGGGTLLEAGEEGEICIRGPLLMSGYFAKPLETRETFDSNEWFHSGDLGSLDAKGHLRFHGRLKDLIRVGGENLSPLEVENLLRRHEKVAEACVVGVPDARLGEVCMAFVQLRPGQQLDGEELMAFCRTRIAAYKVPRHVRFVDGFPMTGNNKIRRVEVKEIARRNVDV
jgi:fatty-acyl-CoA synthase